MQTFSGTDILDLLKQFMKNCPESPPLGGSLGALKAGMVEEEDPHYDYAWDPGAVAVAMNTVMHIPMSCIIYYKILCPKYYKIAGLLQRVVPWGLIKCVHRLAGSNGKGPSNESTATEVTKLKNRK